MSRVKVLGALVLAVAMLVVPAGASLANPANDCESGVFLRGYVVDECGRGVVGAIVAVIRVAHGTLQGKSGVKAQNGEWGVSLSPIPGEYTIRVTLPSGNVTEWRFGYGDKEKKIADAVNEIAWEMSEGLANKAKALPGKCTPADKSDDFVVEGPITIQTDVPCTIPPVGPVYFWGNTYAGVEAWAEDAVPCGDAKVRLLFKQVYYNFDPWMPGQPARPPILKWDWVVKAGPKFSRTGDGLYGFGGNPVPGLYMVHAEKGEGALAGYTLFFVPEGQFGVTSYGPINVFLYDTHG